MNFHFDSNVAEAVGVEAAVMLANLHFWIVKNEANKKHFHDGDYWTYNSQEAFTKIFPFWSRRQIQRILTNLKDDEYIKIGNYNEKGYDKTGWYALTKKAWLLIEPNRAMSDTNIEPNGAMDSTKPCNGLNQTVQPIPYSKPNNKPNSFLEDEAKASKKEKVIMDLSFIDDVIDKVKITAEEYDKLKAKYGTKLLHQQIRGLDTYISNGKGTKYKDHYKTLNNWCIKNSEQQQEKPAAKKKVVEDNSCIDALYQ